MKTNSQPEQPHESEQPADNRRHYIRAWANPTAQAVTGRPTEADIGQVRLQIAF